jgi:hypothetical protein
MSTFWWQSTIFLNGLKPCHVELLIPEAPRRCSKR